MGCQIAYGEEDARRKNRDLLRWALRSMRSAIPTMGEALALAAQDPAAIGPFMEWCVDFCEKRIPAAIVVREEEWVPEMRDLSEAWGVVIMRGERTTALVTCEEGD